MKHLGERTYGAPQDAITAAVRGRTAYDLRVMGVSRRGISEILGISESVVENLLLAQLQLHETSEQQKALEIARLDALGAAIYDNAMSGSLPHVKTMLDIIRSRVAICAGCAGVPLLDAPRGAQPAAERDGASEVALARKMAETLLLRYPEVLEGVVGRSRVVTVQGETVDESSASEKCS